MRKNTSKDPNFWITKARACANLAEAKRGTPEGEVALRKLESILRNHPDIRERVLSSKPLVEVDLEMMSLDQLIDEVDLSLISRDGVWAAASIEQAARLMLIDYAQRTKAAKERQERMVSLAILEQPKHLENSNA